MWTKKLKEPLLLFFLTTIPTFFVWLPFFLKLDKFWNIPLPKEGMATIVANYDGPLYIVIAKTFYNIGQIADNFSFPLPNEYWAAHFPAYPLLIKTFSFVPGGYPYSMLLVTLMSSFLAIYFFNKFIGTYANKHDVLWLTFVFSLFPARWLTVRSVGSPEPLFIASIVASIYYFQNKKYLKSGVWGAVAQLTKSPGILLFVSLFIAHILPAFKKAAPYKLSEWSKYFNRKIWPIFLIPASLFGLFILYGIRFDNFFAYFNSGDNIHLFFPPFQIFNYAAPWVGTFWLEEIIFIYLIGVLGLSKLIKLKDKTPAWFVGIYFITTLFVSHRDLMRYSLPIVPFLFAAWAKQLSSKEFKIAIAVLIIPIYLVTLAFISQNTMPISNWAPLL